MKNFKLSIISGVYFPIADLFRLFLDSCLNQTLDDLEFIFIIDHPNDIQSESILKEYQDKFKNNKNTFKIYKNPKNTSLVNVYKKGFNLSNGEYIVFFDSDDFFDNDYLEKLYSYIKKYNFNYVLGNAITCHYNTLDVKHIFVNNKNVNLDDWLVIYNKRYLLENPQICATFSCDDIVFDSKTPKLPLYEGSFYYHTRHVNNTSNLNSNKFNNDKVNQGIIDYKKLCSSALIQVLKNFKIDPSIYNNDIELIPTIKKYTNLDESDNDFNYDKITSFQTLEEGLKKYIHILLFQIQTKQLSKIKLILNEINIKDINQFKDLINLIKFSGILNCFTFIIDYNIISEKDINNLKQQFVDLNIVEFKDEIYRN